VRARHMCLTSAPAKLNYASRANRPKAVTRARSVPRVLPRTPR
jgi:hypothetical protein